MARDEHQTCLLFSPSEENNYVFVEKYVFCMYLLKFYRTCCSSHLEWKAAEAGMYAAGVPISGVEPRRVL